MVPSRGDRIDGWWNQIPPLDSRSEPWSKCRKEKRFFQGRRKKRALAARAVYVSLDRADAIIEGGHGRQLHKVKRCTADPEPCLVRIATPICQRDFQRMQNGAFWLLRQPQNSFVVSLRDEAPDNSVAPRVSRLRVQTNDLRGALLSRTHHGRPAIVSF